MTDEELAALPRPIRFDLQDFLHSDDDCLMIWDAALQNDCCNKKLLYPTLNEIARFRFLRDLAQQVGVSKEDLYNVLTGVDKYNPELIQKVAEALGLKMHYDDMPNPELDLDDDWFSDDDSGQADSEATDSKQ